MIDRFTGHTAGLGTASGTRIVVGAWDVSPWGAFADVMLEQPDGHRVLLAPDRQVADYVAATYAFDEVRVGPVAVQPGERWVVHAPGLALTFAVGRRRPVTVALRVIPPPVRHSELFARLCDPVARRLMPGVRTHGSAGNGRTEWYAAREVRAITACTATWQGRDLGALAPVRPAVRFGFGSAPTAPSLTEITSHVRTSSPLA